MVSKDDINIQEIVFEYLKAIIQSENKELTINQIVDDIKKYTSEEQPLIIKELRRYLIALNYERSHSFSSNRQILHSFSNVIYQSNEDYIKYVELLDELTKE